MIESSIAQCQAKMTQVGVNSSCIASFVSHLRQVANGELGLIPESEIEPLTWAPHLNSLSTFPSSPLPKTVILKLNGGLGTSMGLSIPKSLLPVTEDGDAFLDLILKQAAASRRKYGSERIRFLLFNSFATSDATFAYLRSRTDPELRELKDAIEDNSLEILQSKVPKVTTDTLEPVSWPRDPTMEWCPPGHGDVYASLYTSGALASLQKEGFEYLFISNADNLAATLEESIVHHLAERKLDFLMEVCERTAADQKGGHVAKKKTKDGEQRSGDSAKRRFPDDDALLLREMAQCPREDLNYFSDISRHRFFSTGNLWIRLSAIEEVMKRNGDFLPLSLIRNPKAVDPLDPLSTPVYQFETAAGAAISVFSATATSVLVVNRQRFSPVKTCADLFVLRSDAYVFARDGTVTLSERRGGVPPIVRLDERRYKHVSQLNTLIPDGAPSLICCKSLEINGKATLAHGVIFRGAVKVESSSQNDDDAAKVLSAGVYEDTTIYL